LDDLINEFLIESTENLDRLDSELVRLESDPSSQELLWSIFRTIHTIKGSCGFLGFSKLEKVAHGGESLLSLLRDGKLSLTAEITSGLLSMVDAIRTILSEIKNTGMDGAENYRELIETLIQLQQPAPASGAQEVSDKPHTAKKSQGIKQEKNQPTPVSGQLTSKMTPETKQVVPAASGERQPEPGQFPTEDIPLGLQRQGGGAPQSSAEPPSSISQALPDDTQSALQTQDESRSRSAQADTIRVVGCSFAG
jgi:two-component system chemotaxis sensor kinase CheA